jgi:TolB-like protein/predicted Ser/Thr protein kinase
MIGQTVSHYRILEKLGEGGMGVVYKALDTKLERFVALKFLPPEFMRDAEARARFIREAQAAAALHHPDICTIYEIDEAEGQAFISMAYVDGESLSERIRRGPLKLEEALEIAVHVAQGLQAAHEKGIVHRDIKSANVMLTRSGQVNVMDFGLAKLKGATVVTREGSTVGTAGYMSPEQARGEEVDSRTDIWSLGVVLYEMVTGLLPFRGEYEQGLAYQIINVAPEPITGLRTGIPMDVERIVSKCLEKNREERYQTAADLIADLRRAQRTIGEGTQSVQPAAARATSAAVGTTPASATRQRRARWWYLVPPLVIAGIVAVIFLIVAPRSARAPEEKSIAVLPFVDMSPNHDQEHFCDGMTDELISRLSNIRGLRVPARTSAFVFKGKTGDIAEIGRKLRVRTVLEGSLRKSGDELRITAQLINVADGYHLWSETYDRRLEDVFAIQDEISSAIVSALQLKLTPQETQRISEHPIENVKAYEYYLKAMRQLSRFDEKSVDSVLVSLQAGIDIMGDNAELYSGMAAAYYMYANIGMGQEEYLERAEEYAKKSLALDPDNAGALWAMGTLSFFEDYPANLQGEFRYFKRALAANPAAGLLLDDLAGAYQGVGKSSEASALLKRLADVDPLNYRLHFRLGLGYLTDCQFEPALEELRIYYEADSTNRLAQTVYSWALACNGRNDEALMVLDRIAPSSSGNAVVVCSMLLKYALLKDKENAFRLMTPAFKRTCRRDMDWSYWVAARLALLGAKPEALDWLENAINRGSINYPFIKCDPLLDNIRGEPQFKRLLERAKYEWEHFEVPE